MMKLYPILLILLTSAGSVSSQCTDIRLLPNSAGLVVTTTVNTPLSFIRCTDSNGTEVLPETYYCGVSQILATSGSTFSTSTLFVTGRDSNTQLLNTVGDWRVLYNAASPFNLLTSAGASFRVRISCSDASSGVIGTSSIGQDLLVYLTPNLQPTIFESPGVSRTLDAKSTPEQTMVYTLTVSDPENDFIRYSLSTEPAVDYFKLDSSNGEVQTNVDLKVATISLVNVLVNVSDGHSVVGPFKITVRLDNLNTRPDITNLPTTVHIREDEVGGFPVITLTVVDPDIFTSLTSLTPLCTVSPPADENKFVQSGNIIRVTSFNPEEDVFDFETRSLFNISCSVNDGFLSSQNEIMLVNISNVNEPPVFNEKVYYCQLTESRAGISSCDLGLSISDPEGNSFTTNFLPGNNSDRFALDNFQNSFTRTRLTFNIDYDVDDDQLATSVVVTIAAVDSIGATGTAKIFINIADANDNAPVFGEILQSIAVDYSTRLGIVGSIKATDKDQGTNGEIDYTLLSVNPPNYINHVFALGNGEIHYAREYGDNIAGSSAYLTIRATDRGSPRRSSTGTVAVAFLSTTTASSTTRETTTTTTTTTTTVATTTTTEYNFFAHTENITLMVLFILTMIIVAAILMFLCARLATVGYCCAPSESSTDPANDYAYQSRNGSANDDGYRGQPDYFDREFARQKGGPQRAVGPGGRPPPPSIRY